MGEGYQYVLSYIPSLRKSDERFIDHDLGRNKGAVETTVWQAVLMSFHQK